MAFKGGQPIQAGLGAANFSPILQGGMAQGQAYANVGQSLGQGIQQVGASIARSKEQKQQYKQAIAAAQPWLEAAKTMEGVLPQETFNRLDMLKETLKDEDIPLSERGAAAQQIAGMGQLIFGEGMKRMMGGGGSDAPSAVREYEYYRGLDDEERDIFLTLKRAQPAVKLAKIGGRNATIAPDGEVTYLTTVEEEAGAEATVAGARTEATERTRAEVQRDIDDPQKRQKAESMLTNITNVIETAEDAQELSGALTTGPGGLLKYVPSTDARVLSNKIDTVRAALAFDRLTEMREASKTGGALGQVSNIELGLLESAVAKLDQLSGEKALDSQLEKVIGHYNALRTSILARRYREVEELGKTPEEINARMVAEFGPRTAMTIRGMYLEKEQGMKPEEVKKQLKKEFNIGN